MNVQEDHCYRSNSEPIKISSSQFSGGKENAPHQRTCEVQQSQASQVTALTPQASIVPNSLHSLF